MIAKIGFIGTGGIAQDHIRKLMKIANAEIVCLYDENRETANQVAVITGAQVMDSADQVLDRKHIDAVFICVPQFARDNLEEIAALRGIHTFVEKPLGLDLAFVHRKEQVIREAGIIHSVGYCLRYYDTVLKAKQYLQGRQVHLIQAYRFGTTHPARWWQQIDMSGGHLVDAVTHQVDMIRFLAGEFDNIYAQFGRTSMEQLSPDSTIYDAGTVSFTMKSGAVGSITESCVSPFHSGSEIKFFSPDFYIHIRDNGKTLTIIDSEQNRTETSKLDPSYEQDKTFIQAVLANSQQSILCDYSDGYKTLEVTLAANTSMKLQSSVKL